METDPHKADGRIVASQQCAVDTLLCDLDLPAVRTKFAELTDAASEILFSQRLDFDDVIVDRVLLVESKGVGVVRVLADWLSDKNRLIEHVVSCMREQNVTSTTGHFDEQQIRIIGLVVELVHQPGPI